MSAPQAHRGEKIGLPVEGRGSLASTGPRLLAFAVDAVASALVAALFAHRSGGKTFADKLPGAWSLIPFALDYVIGVLAAGGTLGMYLTGLRVIRIGKNAPVDPVRIIVRTALLCLLVPALVFDQDGRGMHDRLTDTAVVRG
jgi:uncharacterized RDD family membrane protein YckC